MRRKLALATAAVAVAAAFAPLPGASAICDPEFFERTGYCSPCHMVADRSQRPQDVICPQ